MEIGLHRRAAMLPQPARDTSAIVRSELPYVVVIRERVGNLDLFQEVVGPFDSGDAAVAWADKFLDREEQETPPLAHTRHTCLVTQLSNPAEIIPE